MPRVREIEDDGGDPILKAAKQLSVSIEKSGRLPAALLPLVYLRVALINGCPF